MEGEKQKVCREKESWRLEDRERGGCGSKNGRRRQGMAGEETRESSDGGEWGKERRMWGEGGDKVGCRSHAWREVR